MIYDIMVFNGRVYDSDTHTYVLSAIVDSQPFSNIKFKF